MTTQDIELKQHTITFERNLHNSMHRAICSCGWANYNYELAIVQSEAAKHDINPTEWIEVAPIQEPK